MMENKTANHGISPADEKRDRICGLKRGFFFAVVILLVLTIGLGVGLGIGLTRKNNDSAGKGTATGNSNSQTVAVMQEIKTQYDLPALVIGQGEPGKFASQAIGVRKEGNPTPALKTDIYHLGSNTKAMTATLLALIIQEGQLSWTSTLSEALPGFNISTAQHDTTLEMLTCHRSGLTDAFFSENHTFALSLFNMSAYAGRLAVSNISLSRPPSNKKGTFTYANINYVLAGLVIDVATKNPAEDVLQSRLFTPLGITTAGWGPTPETSDTSIDNPWPHTLSPTGPVPIPFPQLYRDNAAPLNTAGRVHMTLTDYNKFLQLHLAGMMNPSTPNVLNLSKASITKLHEPYPENDKFSEGYGYTFGGWGRVNYSSDATPFTLAHDGSNTYNYAHVILDSAVNMAYMGLTNMGDGPTGGKALLATHDAVNEMRNGTVSLL